MTSLTLFGGGTFSPELGSVIVGGNAEANTAVLSRDGLFGRRELLVPAWLLGGLKVFRSLSTSAFAFEAAPAADTLCVGRISSLSRLGRLGLLVLVDIVREQGAEESGRFRFSDG